MLNVLDKQLIDLAQQEDPEGLLAELRSQQSDEGEQKKVSLLFIN